MSEPSPAYLIDTSWAIRHLRGLATYTEKLSALESSGLAISVITLAELYEGVARSSNPARAGAALDAFVSGVRILLVDEGTARAFGKLSAQMRSTGNHPGDFDVRSPRQRFNIA
jgi:tRNA(fMet)-specific endonuclease VapC